jgi:hypothetical protein
VGFRGKNYPIRRDYLALAKRYHRVLELFKGDRNDVNLPHFLVAGLHQADANHPAPTNDAL